MLSGDKGPMARRVTTSGPDLVANSSRMALRCRCWNSTQAEPNVAWPQRSTSIFGVNQRSA